jgi:hypothetical protein
MGRSRSSSHRSGRRGIGRVAALLALTLLLAGCGGGDGESDSEKEADVEFLNTALVRELTLLDAYTRGRSLLNGETAAIGRRFRAHQQEYVSALTKAVRGLGGETDAEMEDLDLSQAKTQADLLTLAYELESGTLAAYQEASPRLFTAAPRTLATAIGAGHAQHLAVLRQALGASPADAVPEAFDGGEVPPPEAGMPATAEAR